MGGVIAYGVYHTFCADDLKLDALQAESQRSQIEKIGDAATTIKWHRGLSVLSSAQESNNANVVSETK